MSDPYLPPPIDVAPEEFREVVMVQPPRRPYLIHILLFLLTFVFALIVGARLQANFLATEPLFINDEKFFAVRYIVADPLRLLDGLPFAASFLGILMAHEMGHFLFAVKHRVYATLPFFIPAPTPVGTFGAFIQIKSRFRSLAALFDIGIAGPIAGFVVAVPLALAGLALSKPLPAGSNAVMNLGYPPIFHLLHSLQAGWGSSLEGVLLHPVAIAAWIGMLATALNLLPGGQLDGGHMVYALRPQLHGKVTRLAMAILLPLSIFYWPGWLIWVVALWLTRRHPYVPEYPLLDVRRRSIALTGVLMFILSFTPAPFAGGGLWDVVKELLH
ncbi:MAG TPA: site-2 protease family protein [Terriglobales bacterium]|nr:site-2 protease family protein [Terriglobales bacterium]